MSQKDDRDLDAPTPPGSPMRRDEPDPAPGGRKDHRDGDTDEQDGDQQDGDQQDGDQQDE